MKYVTLTFIGKLNLRNLRKWQSIGFLQFSDPPTPSPTPTPSTREYECNSNVT